MATFCQTQVKDLRTSGLDNPLGIDQTPVFSWQAVSTSKDFKQASYSLCVTDEETGAEVWNTGVVASASQYDIRYEGETLQSRHAYRWTVPISD